MTIRVYKKVGEEIKQELIEVLNQDDLKRHLESTFKKPEYIAVLSQEITTNSISRYLDIHNGATCTWFRYSY